MPQAREGAAEEGRWQPDSGFRIPVHWMWGVTDRGGKKMTSGILS